MLKLSFENISEYYFLTSWTFSSFSMNASIWGHQYLFAHILLENTIFPLFWRDGRFILKNCKSCYNSEKGKVRYLDYQFIDKFFNQPSNCREQKSFEKIEPFNWCQRYWKIELDSDSNCSGYKVCLEDSFPNHNCVSRHS